MIDINEGKTNNYLVHGIFAMLGVFIFIALYATISSIFLIPAFIILVLAILLFGASNGLEVDIHAKSYRKYGKVGPYKFGQWHTLIDPISARITMQSSSVSKGASPMMGKIATLDSKSVTYDLLVLDSSGNNQILYDFLEYNKAKAALKSVQKDFKIPVVDEVLEKLRANRMKRSSR